MTDTNKAVGKTSKSIQKFHIAACCTEQRQNWSIARRTKGEGNSYLSLAFGKV